MADIKFEGWFGLDKETGIGGMKWQEFDPKVFEETDVDIKITHCGMLINQGFSFGDYLHFILGVCGSDIHSLRSGLFPTDYPCCAGHEYVLFLSSFA